MMKITLLISAAVMVGMTSCKNEANEQAKTTNEELVEYVDSVKNATPVYTDSVWMVIDKGYQERAIKAEASLANLKEEDKVKTEESKAKYAELKATYETEITKANEDKILVQKQKLRNTLFGEGKIGSDMSFNFVTAQNAREVYHNFVEAVAANKEVYSREDWDEVKVLYEALDNRKNAIEKNLAGKDNLAIAGDKVRFAAINSVNRPSSKIEENSEAKQ